MADDTPTVEQARLELDRAIGRYWPDRQALYNDTVAPAIDALIAAVRAEHIAREWQCRFVADDKRCCILPLDHTGDHRLSDPTPRYGVIAEHDQHGGDGWAVFDRHEGRTDGGWFADRIAAERTADTMNGR